MKEAGMGAGADAETAREALRTLARETRDLDNPPDSYGVLGELTHAIEHLQQVMGQLADWHDRQAHTAVDEDRVAATGEAHARAAARKLRAAAEGLDGVYDAVNTAWTHNGRIIWRGHPGPAAMTPPPRARLAPVDAIGTTVRPAANRDSIAL